jgi:hypothetical protein
MTSKRYARKKVASIHRKALIPFLRAVTAFACFIAVMGAAWLAIVWIVK